VEKFLQTLMDATAVGSLYALIALGYTMVYGILKFINFAHSDVFVLGAWVSLSAAAVAGFVDQDLATAGVQAAPIAAWVVWGLVALTGAALARGWYDAARMGGPWGDRWRVLLDSPLMIAAVWGWGIVALVMLAGVLRSGPLSAVSGGVILIAAMLACGLVGFTLERLAYKPLRSAPRLNVLITAIGVSLLLQNLGQLNWMFGTRPERMPTLMPNTDPLATLGGVKIWPVDLVAGGTAVLLMLGLDRLVFKTKFGRAMRAVSFSERNAALMGIPVDRVISITFVIGAMLAAAAGFLYAQKYPGLNQTAHPVWVLLGLKAFVAAVVGGIGNIRGAMLGGLLIGLLEFFGAAYLSTELRDVYVFGALIIVLLVRPSGILGRVVAEKV
jgi:branched-chain amino acid transport system permease protein